MPNYACEASGPWPTTSPSSAAGSWARPRRGTPSKTGARVALIGPPEQPKTAWATREAMIAHYDEGRITRMTDPDATWAALAARSIERCHQQNAINEGRLLERKLGGSLTLALEFKNIIALKYPMVLRPELARTNPVAVAGRATTVHSTRTSAQPL